MRRVAEQLGYRTGRMERVVSERGTGMLGMIVADIANPVFFGMIHGAERAASDRGFTMLMVETQESEEVERSSRPADSCGGWRDPQRVGPFRQAFTELQPDSPIYRRPHPAGRQGRRGSIDRLDSCRPF